MSNLQQQQVYSNQSNVQILSNLINEFLNLSNTKSSDNKHYIKQVQNNLKVLSKQENYFQIAYEYIINLCNNANTMSNPNNNNNNPNISISASLHQHLFFSSLLLRDKFRYQFDKYSDPQVILYLQTIIKQIIKKYSINPPDTFVNNIAVCIICLYIKRSDELKQKYGNSGILEYYKSFIISDNGSNISPDYFYKALMYTPEEISNQKIVLDNDLRYRVKKTIKASQFQVLKHLNSVAHQLWQKKIIKKRYLFSSLDNWISLGYKQELFKDLPNHFLVQKLFKSCLDQDVSSQACACLKQIIKTTKSTDKSDGLFMFLGNGVFGLIDLINQNIKEEGSTVENNQAIQVITNFGLLASEFFIQNYNQDVKKFLLSTIEYIKIPDIQAYPELVDFWECFMKNILNSKGLNNEFVQLSKHVYAAVCYKNTYTLQMIQRMNQIPQKKLGDFYNQAQYIKQRRQQAQEFFQTMSKLFGQQNYLDFVLSCITQLNKNQPQIFWSYLQSYLNSLKNSLKKLPAVSESVKLLVSSYSQISSSYVCIKNSFMIIFKNLMSIQQQNIQAKAQFIKHLFTIIASNLIDQKILQRSQKAFSKGCEQNPQIVINYIDDFIVLLKQHSGNEQIVKGLLHVLSSNVDVMQKYLPMVLHVQYQIFVQATTVIKRKQAYYSIYQVFKLLNNYKNKEQFIQQIVQFTKLIWPSVLNSLKQPKNQINDEDPQIQRCVKLVKFIMRCLKDQFIPFLQSLFTTILQAYRQYPISSYVYALQVSITVYYTNPSLFQYFQQLYKNFCQLTYTHLKQATNISSYQLLIDDFIGMNKRFCIYNSRIVLESGELPSLIETCINLSCAVEVPKVSKAAYQFFQTIFMIYWDEELIEDFNRKNQDCGDKFEKDQSNFSLYLQLKQFIIPKVSQIIIKMLNHLQKVPLQSITYCILDSLMSQIKAFTQQNPQIWTPILKQIPQQILTNSQKAIFFENLTIVDHLDDFRAKERALQTIERMLYTMNKRFINNEKRKL